MKLVQSVVETEMKSCSSALTKTCSAALAPQKIHAAVRNVSEDDFCSRNVMINRLEKLSEGNFEGKISKVLTKI